MNKEDTICIYGSNQHSGEAMVTGNENLQKLGSGEDQAEPLTPVPLSKVRLLRLL